jgi:hypothetical protein
MVTTMVITTIITGTDIITVTDHFTVVLTAITIFGTACRWLLPLAGIGVN